MRIVACVAMFLVCAGAAKADRITQMNTEERCAYAARLQVLAAHYHAKGKARTEIAIHWHGDETQNEIDFVNQVLDAGYAQVTRDSQSGKVLPLELFGDRAYETCISEKPL